MLSCLVHDWSVWSKVVGGFNGNTYQYKVCMRCGLVRTRFATDCNAANNINKAISEIPLATDRVSSWQEA